VKNGVECGDRQGGVEKMARLQGRRTGGKEGGPSRRDGLRNKPSLANVSKSGGRCHPSPSNELQGFYLLPRQFRGAAHIFCTENEKRTSCINSLFQIGQLG